jgi:SAM-dependent methyltransferase
MRRETLSDKLTRGYFQLWSPSYDRSLLQFFLYRPVHRAVLAAVRRIDPPPRRVVDLGCGTARLTYDLATVYAESLVVGIDVSSGMLKAARRRLGCATLPLVQCNAYALPFGDGTMDLVTSTIAFHWVVDPVAALKEVRRVLRPGGRFVLGTLVARLIPGTYFGMRLDSERGELKQLTSAAVETRAAETEDPGRGFSVRHDESGISRGHGPALRAHRRRVGDRLGIVRDRRWSADRSRPRLPGRLLAASSDGNEPGHPSPADRSRRRRRILPT